MDQELKARLDEIEKQLEANTLIVKKIRRSQKTASTLRTLYWVFIILLGLGAFYFITPFLEQLKETYGIGGESSNFSDFVKQVKEYKSSM